MKTVYVIAHDYESGGGFDWYRTKQGEEKGWEEKKQRFLAEPRLTFRYYRYQVEVPEILDDEGVTSLIDETLVEDCDKAGPIYLDFARWKAEYLAYQLSDYLLDANEAPEDEELRYDFERGQTPKEAMDDYARKYDLDNVNTLMGRPWA